MFQILIVDDEPRIRELIDDMFETMYASDGVGLAAPQVGLNINMVVIDADPVAHGLQDRACQHCDFAAACGFQEGRGGDRVRYIRSVDPGEFWKFVEEESREEGSPCR